MKEVVVLAGGRGQRLRPYTDVEPKPMLRVGRRPILEFVLTNIKKNGFRDVIIAAGYKSDRIKDYFGDGSKLGLNIDYVIEEEPKNTAGALIELKDMLKDDFLVVMGDHLTDMNLKELLEFHKKEKAIVTIALKKVKEAVEYGVVDVEGSVIKGFKEKPIIAHYINTAIYAMNKEVFEFINPYNDIAKDVLPRISKKRQDKLKAYISEDYWQDVGRVKDYEKMRDIFSAVELYLRLFK